MCVGVTTTSEFRADPELAKVGKAVNNLFHRMKSITIKMIKRHIK